MTQQASTPISGVCGFAGEMPAARREPIGLAPMARAITRLAQARHRVKHVPTVEQIRAMAWFDGREPCSYLLDSEQNLVPELPVGDKDPIGQYGLCFTGHYADECLFELVALPNGWTFDLLGAFA